MFSKKSSKKKVAKKGWWELKENARLRRNPSLLTDRELAEALAEHNDWRRAKGKYSWRDDGDGFAEKDSPFTAEEIGRFIDEVCARLIIANDLSAGRFK